MKKTSSSAGAAILAALLLLSPLGARAEDLSYPDSLFVSGVEAYTAADYPAAVRDWEEVLGAGVSSKDLLYNLGNAYFKTDQLAKAILSYERALRLDPSDSDVRYNLDFAKALTQDRIDEVPEFILETWGRKLCYSLGSNVWAVASLVLLALTLSLLLLFLLGPSESARRWGFFSAIVSLVLCFLCWDFAHWQLTEARRHDAAIVMLPVTSVHSSPSSDESKTLFILHEGTKVKLLDTVSGFSLVEIADGRQGWLPSNDIEII